MNVNVLMLLCAVLCGGEPGTDHPLVLQLDSARAHRGDEVTSTLRVRDTATANPTWFHDLDLDWIGYFSFDPALVQLVGVELAPGIRTPPIPPPDLAQANRTGRLIVSYLRGFDRPGWGRFELDETGCVPLVSLRARLLTNQDAQISILYDNGTETQIWYRGETRFFVGEQTRIHSTLGPSVFIRGDADQDGTVTISDAVHLLNWLFRHRELSACFDAADSNDDGRVNVSDAVKVLLHCVGRGTPPAAPYPRSGVDPTADPFECGREEGAAI
jgi:hypothetical protein